MQKIKFFKGMSNVHVTLLSNVGHGFARRQSWLPQFRNAFCRLIQNNPASEDAYMQKNNDLPLHLTEAGPDASTPLVFFLSGDGGWTGFDQEICNGPAELHWPSVGLNCQRYFWKRKTPEQAAADLAPVIRQYLQQWGRKKWVIPAVSVLCIRGDQEENSMQVALPESGNLHWIEIPGSHHYDNDAKRVANTIFFIKN